MTLANTRRSNSISKAMLLLIILKSRQIRGWQQFESQMYFLRSVFGSNLQVLKFIDFNVAQDVCRAFRKKGTNFKNSNIRRLNSRIQNSNLLTNIQMKSNKVKYKIKPSIFQFCLGFQKLILSLFNGPFVDLFQVLREADFFLYTVGSFLLISENDTNLFFQKDSFVGLDDLGLDFGPNIEKFKHIFDCNSEIIGPAEHKKLRQMKEIFRLCCSFVNGAFFVHVGEFFVRDFFVQFFIEFPDHAVDFGVGHLDVHFCENITDLFFGEELAIVRGGQKFEDLDEIFLFCLIDVVFFELLFDGLLFFGLALFNLLNIKVVFFVFSYVFLLKQD